jgi:hypothetical protein
MMRNRVTVCEPGIGLRTTLFWVADLLPWRYIYQSNSRSDLTLTLDVQRNAFALLTVISKTDIFRLDASPTCCK